MTCAEVSELLDAFVDGELPATMLLDVARHASGCDACERAVRDLSALQQVVGRATAAAADALDLSAVWPAVASGIARENARRAWNRRLRAAPLWAATVALAAGLALWLRAPAATPVRVASQPRPNHAIIDRLNTEGARLVALRRERKNGTTLIMVSADGGNGSDGVSR
jgi:anti-sigma factor RsiW